jgi:hypothetical protein
LSWSLNRLAPVGFKDKATKLQRRGLCVRAFRNAARPANGYR